MKTVTYKMLVAAIFIMFLSTACSKKLMPPEIGSSSTSSGGLESSDFTASNPPQDQSNLGSSGGFGDSGFSEEPILESGASVGVTFTAVLDDKDSTSGSETVAFKFTTTSTGTDATLDYETTIIA